MNLQEYLIYFSQLPEIDNFISIKINDTVLNSYYENIYSSLNLISNGSSYTYWQPKNSTFYEYSSNYHVSQVDYNDINSGNNIYAIGKVKLSFRVIRCLIKF